MHGLALVIKRPLVAMGDAAMSIVQPALRFLAWICLLVAVVALVADYTAWQRSVDVGSGTSVLDVWGGLAPTSLKTAETVVERRIGAWAWDPVAVAILGLPTWLVVGVVALLLARAARPRDRLRIFTN